MDVRGNVGFGEGKEGAFYNEAGDPLWSVSYTQVQEASWLRFAASRTSDIYGKSSTLQPAALQTLIIIKV